MTTSSSETRKMEGLWLDEGVFSYRDDLAFPEPAAGELLIRTLATGICGTDLELRRGYYDYRGVAGHEFVGEVVSPGKFHGQRVVAQINIGCGDCPFCLVGVENHCSKRHVIGIKQHPGAFAEYLTAPENNIFQVPDHISNQEAVLVEPLAAALEIQEQIKIDDFDRVLVVGAGRLGVLIAETLATTHLEVSLYVRNPARVKHIGNPDIKILSQDDLIFDRTEDSFPLVIESSGHAGGFETALGSVRPRGTIIMKSTYSGELHLNASAVVVNELTLLGSRCGPFLRAIEWLSLHSLDQLSFSSRTFREQEMAFQDAGDPSIYKVVFENPQ